MIQSLCQEIELRKDYLRPSQLETIYFGGGTPSILDQSNLESIFKTLNTHFSISETAEITLEANPEDISKEKLSFLSNLGVNRLSIGIQSFDDQILQMLNRTHTGRQAQMSLTLAQEAGFMNLNADLIFAIPGRNVSILKKDVQLLIKNELTHISAYGLTIEEKTVFGKWAAAGKLKTVTEDQNADEFEFLMEELPAAGFYQYEISNFSKPGFESRHNSNYWKRVPYLGIGPGAHSYDGQSRQINVSNNQSYMQSMKTRTSFWTTEMLKPEDHINEYIMTSLRTSEGCDLEFLIKDLGYKPSPQYHSQIEYLIITGKAVQNNRFLQLTKSGKMIADQIAGDLFMI